MTRFNTALGYEIKKHPELKEKIIEELKITEIEYNKIIDGRLTLIYPDLKKVCKILKLHINSDIFDVMNESYIIMSKEDGFKKPVNYDKVLDLIDDYIDLKEILDKHEYYY